MFPEQDEQYEEQVVSNVVLEKAGGWSITRADGWSFWVRGDSPIEPRVGMTARFYGKGLGYSVRGLFLDGVRVFYRTEEEDTKEREIDLYGADAAEWLRRWDAGKDVWSIEMGGLGPGYEQAIQITAAEILRNMLAERYDVSEWADKQMWERDRAKIESYGFANETISALGLSWAQWGAAMSLAAALYREGPRKTMTSEAVSADRHIQVSKNFP